MRHPKVFVYLVLGALSLAVVSLGIMFFTGYGASKYSLTELKRQNASLQSRLNETEEARLRLENENRRLMAEINALDEFFSFERNGTQSAKTEAKDYPAEYYKLKEEHGLLQEAYNELLRETLSGPQPMQQGRGRDFTPEQMESFMATARERTYEMMDSRVAQAKTDHEAGILSEIRDISVNLFDLQNKIRNASEGEREVLMQAIGEERKALTELYGEYNSYQWKSLAEQFKIENADDFARQAQQLMQNRQPLGFGREMPQGKNLPQ